MMADKNREGSSIKNEVDSDEDVVIVSENLPPPRVTGPTARPLKSSLKSPASLTAAKARRRNASGSIPVLEGDHHHHHHQNNPQLMPIPMQMPCYYPSYGPYQTYPYTSDHQYLQPQPQWPYMTPGQQYYPQWPAASYGQGPHPSVYGLQPSGLFQGWNQLTYQQQQQNGTLPDENGPSSQETLGHGRRRKSSNNIDQVESKRVNGTTTPIIILTSEEEEAVSKTPLKPQNDGRKSIQQKIHQQSSQKSTSGVTEEVHPVETSQIEVNGSCMKKHWKKNIVEESASKIDAVSVTQEEAKQAEKEGQVDSAGLGSDKDTMVQPLVQPTRGRPRGKSGAKIRWDLVIQQEDLRKRSLRSGSTQRLPILSDKYEINESQAPKGK